MEIKEFIKKYAKPYNAENDDYDVPPFQKNIDNASKSSKIYNMHMYWTKQDPYVVQQYIKHYTKPDIVLDAFAGTGMTGVAAMIAGRHCILCEISPACIHIAKNYTTPIEPNILRRAFEDLKEKIEKEINPLYKTTCHKCKKDAQIANTILSDVFACPNCNSEILFAGGGRWEKMKKGEKFEKISCDNCSYQFRKAQAKFVRYEPVEIRVNCNKCKVKGEKKARPLNEDDWKQYIEIEGGPTKVETEHCSVRTNDKNDIWSGYEFIPVDKFVQNLGTEVYKKMLGKLGVNFIPPKEIQCWYPKDIRFFGDEPKRNLKRGITHPYQMFSRRNLIALSVVWKYVQEIEEEGVREKMEFVFSSLLYPSTLMAGWKKDRKESTGTIRMGTLYIPSLNVDYNLAEYIENKFKFIHSGQYLLFTKNQSNTIILKKSAIELSEIPPNSIDYAYYDPPYGANINYSELNIMWEAWLGEFTNTEDEIIENKYQNKDRQKYEEMMTLALKSAYRVLKPGRILTMVYSYTDETMYRTIQRIAHNAGFVDEGDVLHINSTMKTEAQMDSDKTQQRYLVINFKKPKNGERKILQKSEDIELEVIKVIQQFLIKHPGKTRDYIYDEVIKKLFVSVKIEKFNLDEILKNFFRKVGDEWYAPGTLIKNNNENVGQSNLFYNPQQQNPEKEAILQLQDFLKKYGQVAYSELREFYLRKVKIQINKDFDELITENFKIEPGNKVRLPTSLELEKMQDISARKKIHYLKQYLEGNFKEELTTKELLVYLEFCYNHDIYKEAVKIFSLINKDELSAEEYKKAKKIAEVCEMKI